MKYLFKYKKIIFIGKLIKKSLINTHIHIKLINFSSSNDWLNNGTRFKTSKIWAPVCSQPVVLDMSPSGDWKRSTRTTIQWDFTKIENKK